MPSEFVLYARAILAIEAHLRLVLDQCSVDLAMGTDCFSCLPARAELQKKRVALQVVCCNGSCQLCVILVSQKSNLLRYQFFVFILSFLKLVAPSSNSSWVCDSLFLDITGAENGSSSHGSVGQSVAGSTGGVSKASKSQGSAEKEEQAGNQKRARRQWESWSAEDKNSFFEGLYEVKKRTEAAHFLQKDLVNVYAYFLLRLLSAWEGFRGNPEQHCDEIQKERKAGQHGEKQRAGPAFLLPHLAQDLQTHWLCQWWASHYYCHGTYRLLMKYGRWRNFTVLSNLFAVWFIHCHWCLLCWTLVCIF